MKYQGLDKSQIVALQFKEAMFHEGQSVQQVTCECGLCMPLRFAFKCLYCCQFYCQSCAEVHFGKTRIQYYAEKGIDIQHGQVAK